MRLHAEGLWLLDAGLCALSLLLGGRLAGLPSPKRSALLWWSVLGGAGTLLSARLPALSPLTLLLLPAGAAGCYRVHGGPACVRAALTTLCAALLTGGAGTLLARLGVRALPALAGAAALTGLLCPLLKLLPTALTEVRQVELAREGRAVLLPAMLDSGNLLTDPLTGLPVLVASERALRPLFPGANALGAPEKLLPGFRLLSVRTASGGALLPMFRPERCCVVINGKSCEVDALVAVAPVAYAGVQALVPAAALPRTP